jgi:hypothetical protein
MTGRFVGGAALAAQEYAQHLKTRGEIGFSTWDKDDLVGLISGSPEVGLAGAAGGPLLTVLGNIDQNRVQEPELEAFSRGWLNTLDPVLLFKAALEAGVVANRLRRHERLDLACYVALCLIRAAWVFAHGSEPPNVNGQLVATTGRSLFRHYASDLFAGCNDEALDPLKLIRAHELPSAYVTYPVRCLRLVEILGLLGLLEREEGGTTSARLSDFVVRFFQTNPGTSHPISDRWAVSLIPSLLLLATTGHVLTIPAVLKNVIRWIGDHYEAGSLGLAGPYANPDDELAHLLGSAFEHIALERRSESYVATVVLDLAAILQMKEVFEVARNDFLAVGAMPPVIEVDDTPGQYALGGGDTLYEPNVQYADAWLPVEGWKVAPHHKRGPVAYYLERIGRPWDHLAVSAVLRDRHFLGACRAFLPKEP